MAYKYNTLTNLWPPMRVYTCKRGTLYGLIHQFKLYLVRNCTTANYESQKLESFVYKQNKYILGHTVNYLNYFAQEGVVN